MAYRRIRVFLGAALLAGAAFVISGQVSAQQTSLTPQGMDALAAHATFSTSFTFNKSMLDAASQNMPDDLRPLVAKLRSITVHTFRYSAPGMYDAADVDAVRAQYSGHGWTHWRGQQNGRAAGGAGAQNVPGDPNGAAGPDAGQGYPGTAPVRPADPVRTDVWVRMDHSDFDGIVLLVANERNVNVVVVDGKIDPMELLHLRGHFGIPRDAGDDSIK
ncbi:MAG TPA: hypothetical protein VHX37_16585 [Acidobacteriaceae bacterium]|jgi:hypothetical protein|nr:hypothetical protein [Acidobacteriaceae bacterium]